MKVVTERLWNSWWTLQHMQQMLVFLTRASFPVGDVKVCGLVLIVNTSPGLIQLDFSSRKKLKLRPVENCRRKRLINVKVRKLKGGFFKTQISEAWMNEACS